MRRLDALCGRCFSAQRGLALVAVLWIVAALTLLVGSLTGVARTGVRSAIAVVETARAAALGDAAIQLALLELATDPSAASPYRQRDLVVEGVPVRLRTQSAAGFVDLNGASEELLIDLLVFAGGLDPSAARTLAQRIIDWRDPDDVQAPQGAEAQAYAAAGVSYRPRNARFVVVEDLMQVLGMDLDLYERLRPVLTVWGGQAGVDPAAAGIELLEVLAGGDVQLARTIVARRDQGAPIMDLTTLRHVAAVAPGQRVFRVEAIVALGDSVGRRVRWVSMSRGEWGAPWAALDVQPSTVER